MAHQGHVIRLVHDQRKATLLVEYSGRQLGIVPNVGEYKKAIVTPAPGVTLVRVWTNTPEKNCSSHVLISLPVGFAQVLPEIKSGFGACNTLLRTSTLQRGPWAFWSLVAYRDDNPKVTVAVPSAGRIVVTEQAARPCIFSKSVVDDCLDDYVATGLGSLDRGIVTGEVQAGRRQMASYLNRASSTATLELDGKQFKSFPGVRVFDVESAVELPGSVLFSVWMTPTAETCGHRMLLRFPNSGGPPETLNHVGVCKGGSVSQARMRADKSIVSWVKVMYGAGDRNLTYATWTNGALRISTAVGDACLLITPVTRECLNRLLPADLARIARGGEGSSANGGPAASSQVTALNAAKDQPQASAHVKKAFELLAQNKIDPALAEFDRALMQDANSSWALAGRGYGLAMKGRFDNALSDLDKAVQLSPRFATAYKYRGFVFLLRSEPDRAIAQLDHALSLDPKMGDAFAFRGNAWLAKKDGTRALSDLDQAVKLMPRNGFALDARARVHASRQQHDKALTDFAAAIALSPTSISFRVGRAQSLEALKRIDEATAEYRAALELNAASFADVLSKAVAKQRFDAISKQNANGGCVPGSSTCL